MENAITPVSAGGFGGDLTVMCTSMVEVWCTTLRC